MSNLCLEVPQKNTPSGHWYLPPGTTSGGHRQSIKYNPIYVITETLETVRGIHL